MLGINTVDDYDYSNHRGNRHVKHSQGINAT